jgi:hypothetical protein
LYTAVALHLPSAVLATVPWQVLADWQVWLAEHVCPLAHAPHERVPPHPSASDPHVAPCAAHVVGVHVWHVPAEEQVEPPEHVPQLNVPPHPSARAPHVRPCAAHVVGLQAPSGAGLFIHARMSATGRIRTSGFESA